MVDVQVELREGFLEGQAFFQQPPPHGRRQALQLLVEAERVEAFSTADQEPPADRATFQNPLGTDGGEDADEEAAEDENGLSKT